MSGIRAIPWTFGWTQMRLMLPVWLGLGTALASILERPAGLDTLRDMAQRWPFFDDLLAKVEMVMAKADLEIAGLYVSHLGGDRALFSTLCEEFERTRRALLQIRDRGALLADPKLGAILELRAPILDALSLFQVHLLRTKRACDADDPRLAQIDAVLGGTLSGIAQGLRNTG
jgi:phosphoenolpyruvate carboxylase